MLANAPKATESLIPVPVLLVPAASLLEALAFTSRAPRNVFQKPSLMAAGTPAILGKERAPWACQRLRIVNDHINKARIVGQEEGLLLLAKSQERNFLPRSAAKPIPGSFEASTELRNWSPKTKLKILSNVKSISSQSSMLCGGRTRRTRVVYQIREGRQG